MEYLLQSFRASAVGDKVRISCVFSLFASGLQGESALKLRVHVEKLSNKYFSQHSKTMCLFGVADSDKQRAKAKQTQVCLSGLCVYDRDEV